MVLAGRIGRKTSGVRLEVKDDKREEWAFWGELNCWTKIKREESLRPRN